MIPVFVWIAGAIGASLWGAYEKGRADDEDITINNGSGQIVLPSQNSQSLNQYVPYVIGAVLIYAIMKEKRR